LDEGKRGNPQKRCRKVTSESKSDKSQFYLSGGCYLSTGTLNTHQRSLVKTVIAGHFHSSGNPSYIQLESCIFLIMPHAPLQSEKDVTKARISFIFTRSVKHIRQKPDLRLSQAPLVRITSRSHLLQALFRLSLDSRARLRSLFCLCF
jgi:hypothetical protein